MNPFEKLLALIESWDKKSGNTAKRRLGDGQGAERWEPMREGFQLLLEVNELIAEEEDAEILIDALWEYFLQIDKTWTGSTAPSKISASDMAILKAQKRIYELKPRANRPLTDSEVETLIETLENLHEEIRALGRGLGATGARFLLLVESCLTLLKQEDADPSSVRAKAEQLVGAAAAMTPFIPVDRQEGFWSKVRNVMNPWMGNASAGAAGNMLAQAFGMGELTSGE